MALDNARHVGFEALHVYFRPFRLLLAASAAVKVFNVVKSGQPNKNSQSTGGSQNP